MSILDTEDFKRVVDLIDFTSKVGKVLEFRIPKKPDTYGDGYDDDGNMIYDTYDCPNCGTNYEIDYDGKYKFCPECGQALDWSDNR